MTSKTRVAGVARLKEDEWKAAHNFIHGLKMSGKPIRVKYKGKTQEFRPSLSALAAAGMLLIIERGTKERG